MSKNEILHISVNGDVKQNAEKTLELHGLSVSEAVNLLLHQIILVGGMPFDTKAPPAPGSVVASSIGELYEMLEVGTKQIQAGKATDAKVVMAQIRECYGFSD